MTIYEIKKFMKDNRISQIELSKRSGIPLGSLRNIFSGRVPHPRIDTMEKILSALNLEKEETSEEITDYFCHVLPQTALDFWDEKGEFARFKLNAEDWQTLYNLAEKLAIDKAGKKYWNKE